MQHEKSVMKKMATKTAPVLDWLEEIVLRNMYNMDVLIANIGDISKNKYIRG